MAETNGGVLLAKTLASLGVRDVFALHGGHLDAFLVACPEEGIRLIDTRHEASAGHAADGYARASGGRLGVCVVTAGPGFTNVLTAVANAYLDRIPVLFVAGSPPLREAETNPLQGGFDQVAMAAPVTKWAHRITNVERIPDLVQQGARIAMAGSPGPVFLEIPIDVMFMPSRGVDIPNVLQGQMVARPAPSADSIERTLDLLSNARRPLILAGGGAVLSGSAEWIREFSEATGIPVAASTCGRGILPHEHPSYVGGVAGAGALSAKGLPADVIVQAGARAGMYLGGRSGSVVSPDAKVVQVDVDGSEIGRIRTVDLAVIADCSQFFQGLCASAGKRSWRDFSDWVEQLQAHRYPYDSLFQDEPKETKPGILHPYHAATAAMQSLGGRAIVVIDGGESNGWASHRAVSPGPGQCMSNGYLGCLGVSQGFAIGASIACPDKSVAIFTGDGALGFNIQEFDTMVRHQLPIVTIVMNNGRWAISQRGQDIVFGENRRSIVSLRQTEYDLVAKGFGCNGITVSRYDDISPAVEAALESRLPTCINLVIDGDVVNPAIPQMVGDPSSTDEIIIPYYENIPVS